MISMLSSIYNFLLILIFLSCFACSLIIISLKKDKEATLKAYRDVTVGLMSGVVFAAALLIIYYWKENPLIIIIAVIVFLVVYLTAIGVIVLIDVWLLKKREFNWKGFFGFLVIFLAVGGIVLACFFIASIYINIATNMMSIVNCIIACVSLIIALIALCIASKSEDRMKALTALNFDEKMAMMAKYKDDSRLDPFYYDFRAISHLRCWADPKEKRELIEKVIDIIKDAQNKDTEGKDREIICKIIKIALEVDPKDEVLKKYQQNRCSGQFKA